MWGIEEDDRRPVDGYRGTVTERKSQENRQQTEVITFESEDKEETVQGIDAQKRYEIEICARNEFGFNCSEPFLFPFAITNPILPTEESGGLPTGAIIAIVIILLLLLLCCLLLLLFLLFYCRKERSKNYYPEKNGKFTPSILTVAHYYRNLPKLSPPSKISPPPSLAKSYCKGSLLFKSTPTPQTRLVTHFQMIRMSEN